MRLSRRPRSAIRAALCAAAVAALALPAGLAHASAAETLTAWYPIEAPAWLHDASPTADPLHVSARAGGAVRIGSALGRGAVAFPPRCPASTPAALCPRVVLQAGVNAAHDPGTRQMRFGAVVALAPNETTDGENILQKGFSDHGSQWKLQVDGLAGDPSCVLAGGVPHHIYKVVAPVSIADGGWHAVECQRSDTDLSIVVDQVWRAAIPIPRGLSIANTDPLRIGGKGTDPGNDQFHGYLDSAWVLIG